jgi:hypothetical protein
MPVEPLFLQISKRSTHGRLLLWKSSDVLLQPLLPIGLGEAARDTVLDIALKLRVSLNTLYRQPEG